MNPLRSLFAVAMLTVGSLAVAADGLVALKSPHNAKDTMNRLEEIAKQRGLNVFLRLDHAAGAAKVGKTLRPTELLVFGNPKGGTPLMECAQSAGIDLPLKALVWKTPRAGLARLQRSGLSGEATRRGGLPGRGQSEQGAWRIGRGCRSPMRVA